MTPVPPATGVHAAAPFTSAVLLVIAVASPGFGQSGKADDRIPVTNQMLDGLAGIQGLAISPDGRWLAYRERGSLWLRPTNPEGLAHRIADGHLPTWAPDGSALAYLAIPPGARTFQVFTWVVAETRSSQVTRLPEGVEPGPIDWSRNDALVFTAPAPADSAAWSPGRRTPPPPSPADGTPLVLDADSPDGYALTGLVTGVPPPASTPPRWAVELFVHDLRSGVTRQLTHLNQGVHSPAWSPDGGAIAVGAGRGMGDNLLRSPLYLIDPAIGAARILVPAGATGKHSPKWSPDGRHVAYVFNGFGDAAAHGVGLVDVAAAGPGAGAVVRAGLIDQIAWTGDGNLLTTAFIGVARPLERLNLRTGARSPVSGGGSVVTGGIAVARAGTVAWVESTGSAPAIIMVHRPGETAPVVVHDPNRQLANWALGTQQVLRWRNRHGDDREGVVLLPADYQPGHRYPLIVSAYTQTTHLNGFQATTHPGFGSQAHASRGYVVFFPGPRLPWNHGAFGESAEESARLRGPDGWDITVDDVESGVDALIDRGFVDSTRMAVIGFSNGGSVAVMLATRSTRYRAMVAIAPAHLDWTQDARFEDNRDGRWLGAQTFLGMDRPIEADPGPWVRGSPLFHLDQVRTPVLLAVGDADAAEFTLPAAQLYLGLRRSGRDVTFLRYPGIGHGFYGPAGSDLVDRVDRFLDRRLRP